MTYLGSQVFKWQIVKQVNASILVPSDGALITSQTQLKGLRREMTQLGEKGTTLTKAVIGNHFH